MHPRCACTVQHPGSFCRFRLGLLRLGLLLLPLSTLARPCISCFVVHACMQCADPCAVFLNPRPPLILLKRPGLLCLVIMHCVICAHFLPHTIALQAMSKRICTKQPQPYQRSYIRREPLSSQRQQELLEAQQRALRLRAAAAGRAQTRSQQARQQRPNFNYAHQHHEADGDGDAAVFGDDYGNDNDKDSVSHASPLLTRIHACFGCLWKHTLIPRLGVLCSWVYWCA
jgi:hypothetical protein